MGLNEEKKKGGGGGEVKLQGTEEEEESRVRHAGHATTHRQERDPVNTHDGQITQNMQRDEHIYYDLADHIKERDGHVVPQGM